MRFSVQLLAIAATALSFNATPRQAATPLPVSLIAPTAQAPAATLEAQGQEASATTEGQAHGASPFAWVLAAGFLTLVVLRRTRQNPFD